MTFKIEWYLEGKIVLSHFSGDMSYEPNHSQAHPAKT